MGPSKVSISLLIVSALLMTVTSTILGAPAATTTTIALSGWQEEVADYSTPQWGGSLAIDAQGHQYLIYYTEGAVKYATNEDGSWKSQLVAYSQYSQDREASILVGPQGDVHMTYFAYTDGCAWPFWWHSTLAGGWGTATSLPIGNLDAPGTAKGVAFAMNLEGVERGCYIENGLHYLYLSGGEWQNQLVDGYGVGRAGIAVDVEGVPHIAYPKQLGGGRALTYANLTQASWSVQGIENGNFTEASICLDGLGNVHIIGINTTQDDQQLVHWRLSGGAWTRLVVDSAPIISDCDLKARPDGGVAASYYSSETKGIVYASFANGTWSEKAVRGGAPAGRTSLAFDPEGTPCIAYGQARYVTPAELPTFVLFSFVESSQVELLWSYPATYDPYKIGSFTLYKGESPSTLSASPP